MEEKILTKKDLEKLVNLKNEELQGLRDKIAQERTEHNEELINLRNKISKNIDMSQDLKRYKEAYKTTQEAELLRVGQLQKMVKLTGGVLNSFQIQIENLTELFNYQVEEIQKAYPKKEE